MKFLLDTHIWIWSLIEPSRLSRRVLAALEDPRNELWLSPISIWELIVLSQKKRIRLHGDADSWVREKLNTAPFQQAPLTYEVALETGRLQLAHRDPADRFLVATAKIFELTLITADQRLMKLREIPVLANQAH